DPDGRQGSVASVLGEDPRTRHGAPRRLGDLRDGDGRPRLAAAPPLRGAALRRVPPMVVPSEGTGVISFRYHLVTIVAIFLALGLGLLAGTTVINRVLVDRLRKQTDQATTRADAAERARIELQDELKALGPVVVADKLPATNAVIVTYEGADGTTLDQAQTSLKAAGANVLGVLPITSRV